MTGVQITVDGLLAGGLYMLMAVGLNLIFGVMKVVNFAQGAIMVFSGLVVFYLTETSHLNIILSIVVVALAVVIMGFVVQYLMVERVKGMGLQGELQSLMVTYGLSLILVALASMFFGSENVSLPTLEGSWNIGGITLARADVWSGAVGVVGTVVIFLWLHATHFGRLIVATSASPIGASVCGVNPLAVRRVAFAVGAAMAGLAGAMMVLQTPLTPSLGLQLTVESFVVIAIGGLGSYGGAVVGALGLGLAESISGYLWGGVVQSVVPYAVLLAVLLVRGELSLGTK